MIDVKDHRRYAEGKLAESVKAAEDRLAERNKELLPQAPSDQAVTGDDHLDKMIRAIQGLHNTVEKHLTEVATTAIHSVNEMASRAAQCEYFYSKGKRDAYAEVVQIPARIVTEAKASSAVDSEKALTLVP